MSYDNKFDIRRYLALGREVSERHKEYKLLAPLGTNGAEQMAALEFWTWLKKNGTASVEEKLKKAIYLTGKAELMPFIKELGRFCLILGDTSQSVDYKRGKKKGEQRPNTTIPAK